MTSDTRPVTALALLLEVSALITSAEAMAEARRIIDAVRAEGYEQGYGDGVFDGHPVRLADCE